MSVGRKNQRSFIPKKIIKRGQFKIVVRIMKIQPVDRSHLKRPEGLLAIERIRDYYKNLHRHRRGTRKNSIDQTSENHRNNEANANANPSNLNTNGSLSGGNSNEQATIEIGGNIGMETGDITPHVEPIRDQSNPNNLHSGDFAEIPVNSSDSSSDEDFQIDTSDYDITTSSETDHSDDSFSSAEEVIRPSEIQNDFSDENQNTNAIPLSHPQHESTPVSHNRPLHMDDDMRDSGHETHSHHESQGNRFLFNIVGRISLDEMRQRYTAVMHATKMD